VHSKLVYYTETNAYRRHRYPAWRDKAKVKVYA
jgi:hypothetical protein